MASKWASAKTWGWIVILIAAELFDSVCVGQKPLAQSFPNGVAGHCTVEIIDLNRYRIFNWVADSGLENLTSFFQ